MDQVDESISKPIPELTNEKQNESEDQPERDVHQPISGGDHHTGTSCVPVPTAHNSSTVSNISADINDDVMGVSPSPDPSQRASTQKNEGDKEPPCNNHHQKPSEEGVVSEESRAVVHDNDIGNGSREQETNVRTTTPTIIVETEDDECPHQKTLNNSAGQKAVSDPLHDPTQPGQKVVSDPLRDPTEAGQKVVSDPLRDPTETEQKVVSVSPKDQPQPQQRPMSTGSSPESEHLHENEQNQKEHQRPKKSLSEGNPRPPHRASSPELLFPIAENKESVSPKEPEAEEGKSDPPEVGERVFVETSVGLKMGLVKYVGETQFQPGLWIGVVLDRPSGEARSIVCVLCLDLLVENTATSCVNGP